MASRSGRPIRKAGGALGSTASSPPYIEHYRRQARLLYLCHVFFSLSRQFATSVFFLLISSFLSRIYKSMLKRLTQLGLALALLMAVLGLARQIDPLPQGLRASYFPTENWSGPVAQSTIDPQPSVSSIRAAWSRHPPDVFSVIWSGSL